MSAGRHDRRVGVPWLLVAAVVVLCLPAAAAPPKDADYRWSSIDRVVAVGDVHGAYEALVGALQTAGLIDQALAWSGGDDHFVSVGDVTDRGPESRNIMELLMRLQGEAAAAGGKVHVLLGNHEVMNIIGDLRYVSREEYAAFTPEERESDRLAAFGRFRKKGLGADLAADQADRYFQATFPSGFFGHRAAFEPEGRYGQWLLEQPSIIVINDIVFVHGGLSAATASLGLARVNRQVRETVLDFLKDQKRLDKAGFLNINSGYKGQREQVREALAAHAVASSGWRPPQQLMQAGVRFLRFKETISQRADGPQWYRGSSMSPASDELEEIEEALEKLDARMVVVGHTVTESRRIETRLDEAVVRIDTGMFAPLYQGRSSLLVIEGGALGVLYPPSAVIEQPAVEEPDVPDVLDTDAGLEEFLRMAKVVEATEISSGITKPFRLKLERNGTEMRALFKTVDQRLRDRVRVGSEVETGFTDRYHYEVAAYRLDRLLGFGLVPVTILRRIDGKPGSLQLWIEGAISEKERLLGDLGEDPDEIEMQKLRMRILDALIYNVDRSDSNFIYTPGNWRLHAIDHSRSFRLRKGLPEDLEEMEIEVPPELASHLAGLDLESLQELLDDLLSKDQIKAILHRRDRILDTWGNGN